MNTPINRQSYLEQLIQNKDVELVKIVAGIRRCGKSSLLDLFHRYLIEDGVPEDHIIHMNLESLKYRKLTDYRVYIGKVGDAEIDFVAEKPDDKMYIQVTESMQSGETREREFRPLRMIPDNYEKIVLSMD